jgi:predicted RNA polymerase sigma factor
LSNHHLSRAFSCRVCGRCTLDGYHIFHATHAELLEEIGHHEEAREARLRALDLTRNDAERSLVQKRLFH